MGHRGGSRTVLVTGAMGHVGRHLVPQLVQTGVEVRALSRGDTTADLPAGAERVLGDLANPDSLRRALEGVESVFLLWPFFSSEFAPAALETIARYTRRVVFLSSMGGRDELGCKSEPISFHAEIEGLIERSGLEWTFLRASGFASNALMWAPQIRATGSVRCRYGAVARSPIHECDVAAVATRALTEYGHAGARYRITGPQSLTLAEQVHLIGKAIGRELRWEDTTRQAARRRLLQTVPRQLADSLLDAHLGFIHEPELVTQTVEEITGAPARSFREWASDHAADFQGESASLGDHKRHAGRQLLPGSARTV